MKVIATQERRVNAIKTCIKYQAEVTQKTKAEREQNPEDFRLKKQLGREQSNVGICNISLSKSSLSFLIHQLGGWHVLITDQLIRIRSTKLFYLTRFCALL